MALLDNPWIRYVDRSYQQIKESVLTRMYSKVPEITDHSESNLYVRMLSIWAGIAEMLGYYVDNSAREAFIGSARLYKSVVNMAEFFNYRIHAYKPASVMVTFTLNEAAATDVIIPINTKLSALEGTVPFVTVEAVTIPAGQLNVSVAANQVEYVSGVAMGNTQGVSGETFVLDDTVVDTTVLAKVNGIAWTIQDTLAYSGAVDEHYTMTINENKDIVIRFGNGANGKVLPIGQPLVVDYSKTMGDAGNVPSLAVDTIVDDVGLPTGITMTVSNPLKASGGLDIEDIDTLKRKIPLSIRTRWRAVTDQDYIDVAELYPGVSKAGLIYEGGKTVTMYIVPSDGGVATDLLRGEVETYMEERVMITTSVEVFSAGEVTIVHDIELVVRPGYNRAVTVDKVKENLAGFFNHLNQDIEGTVEIGDVYQIIENTNGVEYSRLNKMYSIPYARPLDASTIALDWVRETLAGSDIAKKWKAVILSPTQYEIYRGNVFVDTYDFGVEVTLPEIKFTVNAAQYNINDSWEFVTYPYSANIDLIEPSIPITTVDDVNITATGGIV